MQKDASFAQQTKGEESVHAESSPCIHTVKLHTSPLVRGVYIFLSILCLILAVLGIVLPGVPSFDFLFLATFFAARSSSRLHRWLLKNRYVNLLLVQYQGGFKKISRLRKCMLTFSGVLISVSFIFSSIHMHLKLSLLLILLIFLLWIWSRSEKIES
ncbi:YbaN family protein [Acinetobacter sp. C32I]|uniref:YbaN family protein n=1 Tax=Acinetobacter sp. C32I TaxID=2950074 RepID=UPI002036B9DF|nr:YbaN family protein [Acinetobacter sp. C32I]USA54460.1 YbaN family protein [Acinetobacter sp. C32I]